MRIRTTPTKNGRLFYVIKLIGISVLCKTGYINIYKREQEWNKAAKCTQFVYYSCTTPASVFLHVVQSILFFPFHLLTS